MYIKILIEKFKTVNYLRKDQGKRYELWLMLVITIPRLLYGYTSLRAIGDFALANQSDVIDFFNIYRSRVPSYSTIRIEIKRVSFIDLFHNFNEWVRQLSKNYLLQKWIALDDKILQNNVNKFNNNQQNFVSMI